MLYESLKLDPRQWFARSISDHAVCGNTFDRNRPFCNSFSDIVASIFDVFGFVVEDRILTECNRSLIVGVEHRFDLDTKVRLWRG